MDNEQSMGPWEILMCTAPDGVDGVVGELWYQHELVVVIMNLPPGLHLTLCSRRDGALWEWPYAEFLGMLEATKARLLSFFAD